MRYEASSEWTIIIDDMPDFLWWEVHPGKVVIKDEAGNILAEEKTARACLEKLGLIPKLP